MGLVSRIVNVFRAERLNRELDEEMRSHIEEAKERGRDEGEAQRAFGSMLRQRQASRDSKMLTWLEAVRADVVFGWRQLVRRRAASAAAVLTLSLAIGACTTAFRLIDAVLLRPLPVQSPERLYFVVNQGKDSNGKPESNDSVEYPLFRQFRASVREHAELLAISYNSRIDLTFGADQDMEKAYRQYVSGWTFAAFGLKPAAGRLFTESDDLEPGAHPYAVLSYDYWTRHFGADAKAIGRTFRAGDQIYEIVGVCEQGFTGTETGTMTDFFLPTMMNKDAIDNPNWSWFRTWVRMKPGASVEQTRQKIAQFESWFHQALSAGIKEANAMALATASIQAIPAVRMVLLKGFDSSGFVFFTNYESAKARHFESNPVAEAAFYWRELERQVRVHGSITRVSREESEEYFLSRPREAQIGAWASPQSRTLPGRAELEARFAAVALKHSNGIVPLPEHWGGYRLCPQTIEFWQGRPNRLHDRLLYTGLGHGLWRLERLAP